MVSKNYIYETSRSVTNYNLYISISKLIECLSKNYDEISHGHLLIRITQKANGFVCEQFKK